MTRRGSGLAWSSCPVLVHVPLGRGRSFGRVRDGDGASSGLASVSRGEDAFEAGTGSPLLLLHGGMMTWRDWKPLVPYLEHERRMIAPTLPGSWGGPRLEFDGRPPHVLMADHAERVLDRAGLSDPVEIATDSYGGLVGLELAARGRASSVVALAPPFAYDPLISLRNNVPLLPAQAVLRSTRRYHDQMGTLLGKRLARPTGEDATATLRSAAQFPLFTAMRRGAVRRRAHDLHRVSCPVTILRGSRDRVVPERQLRHWRQVLPHATFVELPGLPHQAQLHRPDLVAPHILRRSPT